MIARKLGIGVVIIDEIIGQRVAAEPHHEALRRSGRGHDGREVHVAIGDMRKNDAVRLEPFEIARDRLAGEEVNRNGVGGEGVKRDQVVSLRRCGKA